MTTAGMFRVGQLSARSRSAVRRMYVFRVLLMSLSLTVPTIVMFWQSHGMSMRQIAVLQTLFSLVLIGLEVPNGYVADRAGRKRAMVGGAVILGTGSAVYAFSSSFLGFLGAEILLGIGLSLVNGADQALLYDTLGESGESEYFRQVWGRTMAIELASGGIGCVVGGELARFGLRVPFVGAALLFTVLAFVASGFREPVRKRMISNDHLAVLLQVGRWSLWEEQTLRWLLLFSALVFAGFQASFWAYQPYLQSAGIPVTAFGLVYALFGPVAALSAHSAGRVERRVGAVRSLWLMIGTLSISYALLAALPSAIGWGFLLLHQLVRGYYRAIMPCYINERIGPELRATISSVQSVVVRLAYIPVLLMMGTLYDAFSLPAALAAIGAVVVVAGTLLMAARPTAAAARGTWQ